MPAKIISNLNVRGNLIFVILALIIISNAAVYAVNTSLDLSLPHSMPALSKWMDPSGNPKPLHSIPEFNGSLHIQTSDNENDFLNISSEGDRVCVVVHSNICSEIGAGLTRYELDLQSMGYSTVRLVYSGGSAEELRNHLANLYNQTESLAGAVLIGNIPFVIYELMQDWDGNGPFLPQYDDFPCDIFFMDLDGTWSDVLDNGLVQPDNGKYDTRDGNMNLEIWVGRIKTDNLPALGTETDLMRHYFDKNHRYRLKEISPAKGAVVYNDDDWLCLANVDAANLGSIYNVEHVTAISDPELTTADDYIRNRLAADYEFLFLRSHGSPLGHKFFRDDYSIQDDVRSAEYAESNPGALFYSLFVCAGCDYTFNNNLAGTISFNPDDSGLLCWGSTKSGGMFGMDVFYDTLASGGLFGEAFIEWFNHKQITESRETCEAWFYGMTLIGDPAITTSAYMPEPNQNDPPVVEISSPDNSDDLNVNPTTHSITISGNVSIIPDSLIWSNSFTGENGCLIPDLTFSFNSHVAPGQNNIIVTAVENDKIGCDSVSVTQNDEMIDGVKDILSLWPRYIGRTQTGTIEFISITNSEYTVFSDSNIIAEGTCLQGWNIIPFSAQNLPNKNEGDINNIGIQVGSAPITDAGTAIVVNDLSTDKNVPARDLDSDLIYVNYRGTGKLISQGRTLTILNGSPYDKLTVNVKSFAKDSDGVCNISGIIADNGLASIKVKGNIDRVWSDSTIKSVVIKGGDLGYKCKSKLHNVRFKSDENNSKIIVRAIKQNKTKTSVGGNIYANILCGSLNSNGSIDSLDHLKLLYVKGGDIGSDAVPRWLDARSIKKIIAKPKLNTGGQIIDYSFYLTDETKPDSNVSIEKIVGDSIIDTSDFNDSLFIICGYPENIDPHTVSDWSAVNVGYSLGKLLVKSMPLEGTFVIKND